MIKPFHEALSDGFKHIKNINNPELIKKFREEGILIDQEGYYSFVFGDKKEFELSIEPIGSGYMISLYKNRVRITEPLLVKPLEEK